MIGIWPLGPHARLEVGIIELAAAQLPNAAENFFLLKGNVLSKPLFKKWRDSVRQAQWNVSGRFCSCFCCGRNDGGASRDR